MDARVIYCNDNAPNGIDQVGGQANSSQSKAALVNRAIGEEIVARLGESHDRNG